MQESLHKGGKQVAPNLYDCADGKLRWVYEMSLWRNPTLFFTLLKVFMGIVLGMAVLLFFIRLGDGIAEAGVFFLQFLGIVGGIMLGLVCISYCIYAFVQGNKYCVTFEMDEKGVRHTQYTKQMKKVQALAALGMLVGVAKKSPATVGSSLLAAGKSSSYSDFSRVKKIVIKRRRHTIYVIQSVEHNQVYASKEQFDFVLSYIVRHCPKAVVSGSTRQPLLTEYGGKP